MMREMISLMIGDKGEPFIGYFSREHSISSEVCQALTAREMSLKRTLSVRYGPSNDRVRLTNVTFRDVYRILATRVLSLGVLKEDDNREASKEEKEEGSPSLFRKHLRHNPDVGYDATVWKNV